MTAFAHANSLRVSVEKNYIQAYVGEDVRLKCMIADVEEGLLVEWFIGDTKIWEVNPATGKNLAFLNYHGRVTGSSANLDDIFNNGHSLSFRPVKESDASHYKCRARNVKDDSQGEESIQLAVACKYHYAAVVGFLFRFVYQFVCLFGVFFSDLDNYFYPP